MAEGFSRLRMTKMQVVDLTDQEDPYHFTLMPSPEVPCYAVDNLAGKFQPVPEKPSSPGMDCNLAENDTNLESPECNFQTDCCPFPGKLKVINLRKVSFE